MGAKIETYVVDVAEAVFTFAAGTSSTANAQVTFTMKGDTTYRFDHTESANILAFSITDDGVHTDTDGEGTMGVASVAGVSFYVDGTLLVDIAEGDSAATQFAAAHTAGEGEDGGWETSLYIDIAPLSLAASTMYYFDADTEAMGGTINMVLASMGTVSAGPSYRSTAGGEHHKAPPSMRLAKKGAVRSAALQGITQAALDENTSTGTKRGSNNSGHPPLAGGETVGGGSKGHSN